MTPVIGVIVIVEMTCQLALAAELVLLTDSDSREGSWTRTSDEFSADNRSAGPLIIRLSMLPAHPRSSAKLLSFILTKMAKREREAERDYQNKLICSHFPHLCKAVSNLTRKLRLSACLELNVCFTCECFWSISEHS